MCPTNFQCYIKQTRSLPPCSCYMHVNNLEVVATLCSQEFIFSAGPLLLLLLQA